MRTASLCVVAGACVRASAFVPTPNSRFIGNNPMNTRVLARRPVPSLHPQMVAAGGDNNGQNPNPWEAFSTDLAKKFAVVATIAAVAFAAPGDALAARSGGRMGGRSFSSPSVRGHR